MKKNVPEISVVVLCYRAGDFAITFAKEMKAVLEKKSLSYEMILVGNYKKELEAIDATPRVVTELASRDPHIVPVVKEKKGMMGWDMKSGFEVARGRTVAVIDGDGQMFPEDIVRVFDLLRSTQCDIAKTYRNERHDGFYRTFVLSKTFNMVIKLLFPKVKVIDVNSKPKIFTHQALQKLQLSSNDWFIDAEIILKASYLNLRIAELPTTFRVNAHRPSFVSVGSIFEFMRNLIVYRTRLFIYKEL